jgi:transcriptional regulator with XRE-family HTH domain
MRVEQSPVMVRGGPQIDPRSREAVGLRLRALRMGLGFTLAYMASRIESRASPQLWANYERGDRMPRYPTLLEISRIFGVSILWILEGRADHLTMEQGRIIQLGERRIEDAEKDPKRGRKGVKPKKPSR